MPVNTTDDEEFVVEDNNYIVIDVEDMEEAEEAEVAEGCCAIDLFRKGVASMLPQEDVGYGDPREEKEDDDDEWDEYENTYRNWKERVRVKVERQYRGFFAWYRLVWVTNLATQLGGCCLESEHFDVIRERWEHNAGVASSLYNYLRRLGGIRVNVDACEHTWCVVVSIDGVDYAIWNLCNIIAVHKVGEVVEEMTLREIILLLISGRIDEPNGKNYSAYYVSMSSFHCVDDGHTGGEKFQEWCSSSVEQGKKYIFDVDRKALFSRARAMCRPAGHRAGGGVDAYNYHARTWPVIWQWVIFIMTIAITLTCLINETIMLYYTFSLWWLIVILFTALAGLVGAFVTYPWVTQINKKFNWYCSFEFLKPLNPFDDNVDLRSDAHKISDYEHKPNYWVVLTVVWRDLTPAEIIARWCDTDDDRPCITCDRGRRFVRYNFTTNCKSPGSSRKHAVNPEYVQGDASGGLWWVLSCKFLLPIFLFLFPGALRTRVYEYHEGLVSLEYMYGMLSIEKTPLSTTAEDVKNRMLRYAVRNVTVNHNKALNLILGHSVEEFSRIISYYFWWNMVTLGHQRLLNRQGPVTQL